MYEEAFMRKYIITLTVTGLLLFGSCDFLAGPPVYTGVKAGDTNAGVVDKAGTVHLLFSFNTSTEERMGVSYIYYAHGDPNTGWTTEIVYDGEGSDVYAETLGIAPDGTIHAVYRYGRTIYHARRNSDGTWNSEVLNDDEAGPVGEMAFDADGGIHVSHSGYKTDTLLLDNLRPMYSYKAPGGSWTTKQIPYGGGWADVNYGRSSSIATDSTGKAHLAFGKEGNVLPFTLGKIYYSSIEAGGGTVKEATDISSSVTGTVENDLVISPDGTIHVVFTGSGLRYLYSTDGGTSWNPDDTGYMVDDTEGSGYSPDGVIDSFGNLRVAYLVTPEDAAQFSVKLARLSGGTWTLEEPDPAIHSWDNISHMIASDDTTYILYTEDTAEAEYAKYRRFMIAARTPAGEWTSSTVMGTTIPED